MLRGHEGAATPEVDATIDEDDGHPGPGPSSVGNVALEGSAHLGPTARRWKSYTNLLVLDLKQGEFFFVSTQRFQNFKGNK